MVFGGILAGGTGARMGSEKIPKQFMLLCGKPVITYSLQRFMSHGGIDKVITAAAKEQIPELEKIKRTLYPSDDRLIIIEGGSDRNKTLAAIAAKCREFCSDDDAVVVTHDAARPFVSEKMITENIEAAEKYGACGTAIPSSDTVFCCDREMITEVPDRSRVYLAQTPQSFKLSLFERTYPTLSSSQLEAVTDACKVFRLCGYDVHIVQGDRTNIKLTYPTDLELAEVIAKKQCE